MLNYTILLTLLMFSAASAFSQTKICNTQPSYEVQLTTTIESSQITTSSDFNGTFQIQIPHSSTAKLRLTASFIEYIESKREKNNEVILELAEGRFVLIPSQTTIESSEFTPFESLFVTKL